jgi:hypothetical protein
MEENVAKNSHVRYHVPVWRGGRVVEGTTLLTWRGVKPSGGSNPLLSATIARWERRAFVFPTVTLFFSLFFVILFSIFLFSFMRNFKKISWYTSFSLAILTLVGAGCTATPTTDVRTDTSADTGANTQATNTAEATNGTATEPATNTDTTPTTETANVYADGTYSATGTYSSPAGKEEVPVTLTLVNGVITDASVSIAATNATSKQFQAVFSENFAALVVGKNIDDVNLSKVSGSSLTPKGFNDAISQIKGEARG